MDGVFFQSRFGVAVSRRGDPLGPWRNPGQVRRHKQTRSSSGILYVRQFVTMAESGLGSRSTPQLDMEPLVLTVDLAGLPQAWVDLEEAITYHAKLMVAWSVGGVIKEFRGGWQRSGQRSRLSTKSILAIKGSATRCCSRATVMSVRTAVAASSHAICRAITCDPSRAAAVTHGPIR